MVGRLVTIHRIACLLNIRHPPNRWLGYDATKNMWYYGRVTKPIYTNLYKQWDYIVSLNQAQ